MEYLGNMYDSVWLHSDISATHNTCKNPQNEWIICFWVSQEKVQIELDFEWKDVIRLLWKGKKYVPSVYLI